MPRMLAPAEEGERWYCVRCKRTTRRVLWLVDLRRHVHAARTTGSEGIPVCCGGEVVRGEAPTQRSPRPGEVVYCTPSQGSLAIHIVRLGRPADLGEGSWSGTALCGRDYRCRLWLPLPPDQRPQGQDGCAACEASAERTNARPRVGREPPLENPLGPEDAALLLEGEP